MSKRPHSISFKDHPSLTKQTFKDECNINKIMDRFQKTGALDHYSTNAPEYGDVTNIDLQDAMMIVSKAETMFEELPSSIRKKFENDPGQFLEFVQDEKNLAEMQELGLAERTKSPAQTENSTTSSATSATTAPQEPSEPLSTPPST